MNIQDIFPYNADPNTVSVYVGRVIQLNENFDVNGKLFIDLEDPNSLDLDKGALTSVEATASYSLRNLHKCWQSPPEIKSKTNFMGSMTATMSGDFHLQNYCFDMQTLAWFTTVSGALNALGIVNVPPVMVSMDMTPFPGKAVSINIAEALQEFINELLDSFLREIDPEKTIDKLINVPSKETVIANIENENISDPVTSIIWSIIAPIKDFSDLAVKPYIEFIECISLIFKMVKERVKDVYNWTFPITQFSDSASPENVIAARREVSNRIDAFDKSVKELITDRWREATEFIEYYLDKLVGYLYDPIAYVYTKLNDSVKYIATSLKSKLVGVVNGYIRKPMNDLAVEIAMTVQPMVASLPTIVQLVVKYAIKNLLQKLLGVPIKALIKPLADPIKSIMEKAVEDLTSSIDFFFSTAIGSIVNPVIKEIQSLYFSIIPAKEISELKGLLESWASDADAPIPLKIYVDGASTIPKTFEEIDWSDPKDIAAFILALYNTIKTATTSPGDLSTKEEGKGLFTYDEKKPNNITITYPFGNQLINVSASSMQIDLLNGNSRTISPNDFLEGGKFPTYHDDPEHDNAPFNDFYKDDPEALLFFEEFDSKESFLPVFESLHKTIPVEAKYGEGIYQNAEKLEWLTNGVTYIETEIEGNTERYITTASNIPEVIIVGVIKDEHGEIIGDKKVTIEPLYLYKTIFIPHIPKSADDPNVGVDLVPDYIEIGDGESATNKPIKLETPKTNEEGEILYTTPEGEHKTFNEIANRFYRPLDITSPSQDDIATDLADYIKLDPDFQGARDYKGDVNYFAGILISKCFTENSSVIDGEESKHRIITPTDLYIKYDDTDTQNIVFIISTQDVNKPTLLTDDKTDCRVTITLKKEDYSKESFKIEIPQKNEIIPGVASYEWKDINDMSGYKAVWSCKMPSSDLNSYCAWVVSYLKSVSYGLKQDEQQANQISEMIDLISHAISALGQDNFDSDKLVEALENSILSSFDKISSVADDIDKKLGSFLDTQNLFDNMSGIIGRIQNISDTISSLEKTVRPALRATAQSASAVALQTCNMTQAATGKDFTFSSGDSYDLSTTADAKLQLPYCRELMRESFLEPNTKVLVLASGLGKQNLFVVDILN